MLQPCNPNLGNKMLFTLCSVHFKNEKQPWQYFNIHLDLESKFGILCLFYPVIPSERDKVVTQRQFLTDGQALLKETLSSWPILGWNLIIVAPCKKKKKKSNRCVPQSITMDHRKKSVHKSGRQWSIQSIMKFWIQDRVKWSVQNFSSDRLCI